MMCPECGNELVKCNKKGTVVACSNTMCKLYFGRAPGMYRLEMRNYSGINYKDV